MKKIPNKILLLVTTLIAVGVFVLPHSAQANWVTQIIFGAIGGPVASMAGELVITGIAAELGTLILSLSAWFLNIVGILLNISVILTLNIKQIYQATPAIGQLWLVIRNISSMFIIFALLWASIATILDVGKVNIKDLVKRIFIAGMLINFSLFFTKVLIDGSNLISLQFYRAIVPRSIELDLKNKGITEIFTGFGTDGGLSDAFMYNLKITKIFDVKNNKPLLSADGGGPFFKIIVATFAGSVLMILASLSFLAASIAFIIRLVMLLLLMAFSPIYFIGNIFPSLASNTSKKWADLFEQQIVFMPVYFLFMYVALRFISTMNPNDFFSKLDGASPSGLSLSMVGILLQYTFAFFLINLPLVVAVQTGGMAAKIGENAKKWAGGYLAKHSIGRVASMADKALDSGPLARFSNLQPIRDLRAMTTQTLAGSRFGGSGSFKDLKTDKEAREKKGREIDKMRALDDAIAKGEGGAIKKALEGMTTSEIAALSTKKLTNPLVVPHISSAVHKAIEKDDKNRTEEDKEKIKISRFSVLEKAVEEASKPPAIGGVVDTSKVKSVMKNMSGDDLKSYIESHVGSEEQSVIIENIRGSQIKDMDDMDENLRRKIGDSIQAWRGGTHPAWDEVKKNKNTWLTNPGAAPDIRNDGNGNDYSPNEGAF